MKQIVAVVKPFRAQAVLEALAKLPLEAIAVSEAKGYGRQKTYLDRYAGSEYATAFLPKVQITAWVDDEHAEQVARTIIDTARTGRIGDGKIIVLAVEEIMTIDL